MVPRLCELKCCLTCRNATYQTLWGIGYYPVPFGSPPVTFPTHIVCGLIELLPAPPVGSIVAMGCRVKPEAYRHILQLCDEWAPLTAT